MTAKTETVQKRPHRLEMKERAQLAVTGVEDVVRADEREIVLSTARGRLTIQGKGMKISRFSEDSGELGIDGQMDALEYGGEEHGSFWVRLFG